LAVQLAADLGYGVPWLTEVLTIAIVLTTAFLVYVTLSTKSKHIALGGFDKAKYELHKYHAERYWGIFVAGMLIWLYFLGFPWMPPVAFSQAIQHPEKVHTIKIVAGQWFWKIEDGGIGKGPAVAAPIYNDKIKSSSTASPASSSFVEGKEGGIGSQASVKVGETVKFVARSTDVNHGFSILSSSKSMDSPLMQMQVVPGFDNVFYYTFKNSGTYTIRCLEYCGWNHPYMIQQIIVVA
jgi:heme/copper-type cytochrome/quinol oxidase subunit 2